MNIRNRDMSVLGFTMAFAMKTEENTTDEKLKYRVKTLRQVCRKTAGVYPGGLIQKKEMKKINKMVEYLIEKTFCIGKMETSAEKEKTITALSALLCIIDEILKNSKNKWYVDSFSNINKKINWLLSYVDPKLNHYSQYVAGEKLYSEINSTF